MIQNAIDRASSALLSKQKSDGSWVGEVDLNPGPSAQAVMLFFALRKPFPAPLVSKVLHYLKRMQNEDGGWSPHYGAPSEVSLTTECYVALRLIGLSEESSECSRARHKILELGGVSKANPWTQLYLGVLGVITWERLTRIPVESLLLSKVLPVKIEDLAYWVKVIAVPMMLLGSVGPGPSIALASTLKKELEITGHEMLLENTPTWLKHLLKLVSKVSSSEVPFLRKQGIEHAMEMIDAFTEASGDFGGNSCTAINVLLCLDRMGKSDTEKFSRGLEAMMSYAIETAEEWRLQTCQSHIWDTGFALGALAPNAASPRSISWLKDRQILEVKGLWSRNVDADPAGWCFGNRHDHFPVTDCTALAVMGIAKHDSEFLKTKNAEKAIRFLVGFQHEEGGWSAYEKFRGGQWLDRLFQFKDIPNALSDLPKNDVSAKVLEALALYRNVDADLVGPALARGRNYLLRSRFIAQTGEKIWKGNYGVNTLYGTAFSAKALRAIDGEAKSDWADDVKKFFLSRQNEDGGFGEAEVSYRDPAWIGKGASNPVQTAWGLLGLTAASNAHENKAAIRKACDYLVKTQHSNGDWEQIEFLGTVFPEKVYFRYELYSNYFPLMALRAAYE